MMDPAILQQRAGVQLLYNLPHCTYETIVIPQQTETGSKVIIYAHSLGIRVVWYGGKKRTVSARNVNGAAADCRSTGGNDNDLLGPEEKDIDPSASFEEIHTYRDIHLDTAALRIAIPSVRLSALEGLSQDVTSKIYIVAACADKTIRLSSLPLDAAQAENAEIHMVTIQDLDSHPELISSITMTMTATTSDGGDARPPSRSRSRSRHAETKTPMQWSLLVASTSPSANGLLLVHQLPIGGTDGVVDNTKAYEPVHRQLLGGCLMESRLSFNPSPYPAERHSHLLLTIADAPAVRIYNVLPQRGYSKHRRGSAATTDSASSDSQTGRTPVINGKQLVTLLPGFLPLDQPGPPTRRKRVLDAAWIARGRAIIALLEDGEWGLWDVEAVGPNSKSSNNLVKGQGNVSGIYGGALTTFSVKGNLDVNKITSQKSTRTNAKSNDNSSLAPMTPHTRKSRSSELFTLTGTSVSSMDSDGRAAVGRISVLANTINSTNNVNPSDELVMLKFGSANYLVPSIQNLWRSQLGAGRRLDIREASKPILLPPIVGLAGKENSAALLPGSLSQTPDNFFKGRSDKAMVDFIVSSSSRLAMFVTLPQNWSTREITTSLPISLSRDRSTRIDQTLLESGELDIDGVDRILDTMTRPNPTHNNANGVLEPEVAEDTFKDAGGDIHMDSPSLRKTTKSKVTTGKNGKSRAFA